MSNAQPTSSHNLSAAVITARGFSSSLAHDIAQAHTAKTIVSIDWKAL